jgi:hypothetical protein
VDLCVFGQKLKEKRNHSEPTTVHSVSSGIEQVSLKSSVIRGADDSLVISTNRELVLIRG